MAHDTQKIKAEQNVNVDALVMPWLEVKDQLPNPGRKVIAT